MQIEFGGGGWERSACLFTINGYLLRQIQSMLKSKWEKQKKEKFIVNTKK